MDSFKEQHSTGHRGLDQERPPPTLEVETSSRWRSPPSYRWTRACNVSAQQSRQRHKKTNCQNMFVTATRYYWLICICNNNTCLYILYTYCFNYFDYCTLLYLFLSCLLFQKSVYFLVSGMYDKGCCALDNETIIHYCLCINQRKSVGFKSVT